MRTLLTASLLLLLSACAPSAGVVSDDPMKPGKDLTNESAPAAVPWTGDMIAAIPFLPAASVNPEYAKKSITGRCVCRASKDVNIDTPCRSVTIAITDKDGKELARMSTQSEFGFQVTPKTVYRLAVISERYRPNPPPAADYLVGDNVIVSLLPK